MALVLLNTNSAFCAGQFDGYDALLTTMLGGEVAMLVGYGQTGSDKHASDIADGYANNALAPFQRPIVTTTLAGAATEGPLFLTDDGIANYGTSFGSVVGGMAGQVVSGGALLGPHTMTGSGKVTLWGGTGLFGVTLDALDTAANGVVPTNGALAVGTELAYTSAGKLTPNSGGNKVASARTVARFVEFSTGDSLVTSNKSMTRLGIAGGQLVFKYAVINWVG